MSQVVVVGSLNMDLVVKAPRIPVPGETIQGENIRTFPGGKGANQAVAAARLGARVTMVGRVGNDAFGPGLIDNLSAAGVGTSHVLITDDTTTGTAIIVVGETGENMIVISPGANVKVSREDVKQSEDLLHQADLLLLQLEVPLETVEYAAYVASLHQTRVILNPAPAQKLPPGLISRVDYLIPNEIEASQLTGVEVRDIQSAEEAALKFFDIGVPVVIITMGKNGALVATKENVTHIPAKKTNAVDTTAAGDAFVGGLVAALARSLPIEEAVQHAIAAGTLAVTKFGAQTSLPTAAELRSFMERD